MCSDVMLSLSFGTDVYIESFLKEWKNDYKRLERVHSYIQWYVSFAACGACFGCVQSELMSSYCGDLAVGSVLHTLEQRVCSKQKNSARCSSLD